MRIKTYALLVLLGMLLFPMAWAQPAAASWTEAKLVNVDADAAASDAAKDRYALQAGAYSSEDKAFEQAEILRERGFDPYVLAVRAATGKNVQYAVRVSLHATLAAANKAKEAFQAKSGEKGVVTLLGSVAPYTGAPLEDTQEKKDTQEMVLDDGLYFLQVGAFVEREHAHERLEQYKAKGYEPGMVLLHDQEENPWIIVYVGRYDNAAAARKAAKAFRQKEGKDCYVNLIDRKLFESRIEKE